MPLNVFNWKLLKSCRKPAMLSENGPVEYFAPIS